MARRSRRIGGAAAVAAAPLLVAGCLARGDFVPPPAPRPVRPAAMVARSTPEGSLSVQEAVRLALEKSPEVGVARARVASAMGALRAAEASLWPRLGAGVSVLRSDAPSTFLFKSIDAHTLAPGTDFNDPGTFENTEAGLTLEWNLWNGGRDALARWAAEAELEGGRARAGAVRNALAAAVVAAWLDARAAAELIASDEASVRSVEAQVADTAARLEGGAALRSDLLSLEVRLAEARERLVRAQVARERALATLRHLMAVEPGTPLELEPGAIEIGPPPESLVAALGEAYAGRPEVRAARKAVERARLALEAADRAWLPRLDLAGRLYAGETDLALDLNEPNATVALALSADVFDGGARRAAAQRTRAALDEMEEVDRRVLFEVALDVERAWLDLREARARVDVAEAAVGASEESLDLVEKQFRGGSVPVTRFLEAEAARSGARGSRIRARLDLERAEIGLARSLGRLAPGP